MPSVAAADVVIVVVDCAGGCLLCGRRTAVDSGVVCDQVGMVVWMGFLILGYQPALPGVRAVIEEEPSTSSSPASSSPAMSSGYSSSMSRAVSGSSSASNCSRDSPDSCSSAVEPNQCAAADAGQPQPGRHAFGLQATYRRARSCVQTVASARPDLDDLRAAARRVGTALPRGRRKLWQ
jgi:hypothetical protein